MPSKKTKNIVALIGVRGGSKRVPFKNSREFAGSNLLEIKVRTLLQVPELSAVVVNSDCENLLEIAKAAGAKIVLREPAFATDTVTTSDYYRHISQNCEAEVILSATVTTPLMRPDTYRQGIDEFLNCDESVHDSVTSAYQVKEFLYQDGKPLNYDPRRQVRSQDLPEIFALNYGFSIIRRSNMIAYKNIVGKNPKFVITPRIESIDIDDFDDFHLAATMYEKEYGCN